MKTNHKLSFCLLLLAASAFSSVQAATLNVLHNFTGSADAGTYPAAALVQGSDGNFYGTAEFTTFLGSSGNYGVVFTLTPAGGFTTLATFGGTDGANPKAALVQGSDGNFYSTTSFGSTSDVAGTVFKITPAGVLTTLATFNGANGAYPEASLVQGSDGNFYGTTLNGDSTKPYGTVFKMTPAGVLTTLYSFAPSGPNGAGPAAGLVQGNDGNFYGTTDGGGTSGLGTVFKITPTGVLTTLASFNSTNGAEPLAALVQGSDGNFYGTTAYGGSDNLGTVFKITPKGVLTALVSFNGTNGTDPVAALVQGSDGNFYGITERGGSSNLGTIFRMTPAGVLTTLVSFNGANGAIPAAALVQGSDGNFYGTTAWGGITNEGVIFQLIFPPTLNFEAEGLSYTSSGATNSVQTDSHSSGGKWVELASHDNDGDHIDFTIPNIPAGTYQLSMKWKGNSDRGILQLSVDGAKLGSKLDQYSSDQTYPTTTFGNVTFAATGNHPIRLTVAGKNSSSSAELLSADKFTFVGQ